jgi:hypothetical protein
MPGRTATPDPLRPFLLGLRRSPPTPASRAAATNLSRVFLDRTMSRSTSPLLPLRSSSPVATAPREPEPTAARARRRRGHGDLLVPCVPPSSLPHRVDAVGASRRSLSALERRIRRVPVARRRRSSSPARFPAISGQTTATVRRGIKCPFERYHPRVK